MKIEFSPFMRHGRNSISSSIVIVFACFDACCGRFVGERVGRRARENPSPIYSWRRRPCGAVRVHCTLYTARRRSRPRKVYAVGGCCAEVFRAISLLNLSLRLCRRLSVAARSRSAAEALIVPPCTHICHLTFLRYIQVRSVAAHCT